MTVLYCAVTVLCLCCGCAVAVLCLCLCLSVTVPDGCLQPDVTPNAHLQDQHLFRDLLQAWLTAGRAHRAVEPRGRTAAMGYLS